MSSLLSVFVAIFINQTVVQISLPYQTRFARVQLCLQFSQRDLNYLIQTFALRAQNFTSHYSLNDLFITLKEYCALSKTIITNSICNSLLGFTFQKVYILIPLRTTERQFCTTFKKFMISVITWMYNRNSTTIVSVFLFLTYIFKLLIWGLFYLIIRFIALFY